MFKVIIKPRAEKEFKDLPGKLKKKIYNELEKLSVDPLLHSQVKKIKGTKRGYRLRVARWRILFSMYPGKKRIEIIDIFLKKGKQDYLKRRKLIGR